MAHSTRPQLASEPNMAAFTREEPTTALLSRSALSSLRAPDITQVTSLLAPSPSPAMARARWRQTYSSASRNAS